MALASTARGTAANGAAGGSLTLVPSGNLAALSLAVLVIAYDNSGGGGADPYTAISDTNGNTWTPRHDTKRDPGTASSGCILRIFTTSQDVGVLTTGDTITVSAGSSAAYAAALWEITAVAGSTAQYLATGTGAGGASTAPSVTTSSITSGDLVVGGVAYEYGEAPAGSDTDTTNGSWSTRQNNNAGSTTSGMSVCTQTKVTTGTGAQTYDPTYTNSSDWAAGWISIDEVLSATGRSFALLI